MKDTAQDTGHEGVVSVEGQKVPERVVDERRRSDINSGTTSESESESQSDSEDMDSDLLESIKSGTLSVSKTGSRSVDSCSLWAGPSVAVRWKGVPAAAGEMWARTEADTDAGAMP